MGGGGGPGSIDRWLRARIDRYRNSRPVVLVRRERERKEEKKSRAKNDWSSSNSRCNLFVACRISRIERKAVCSIEAITWKVRQLGRGDEKLPSGLPWRKITAVLKTTRDKAAIMNAGSSAVECTGLWNMSVETTAVGSLSQAFVS
mgnify:CR=1 FL=1